MSAPVPQANYAANPTGYEKISPGHYRRREDDPEAEAAERAIEVLRERNQTVAPPWHEAEASPLDEIATLVRLLTYGEMMDLAAALWKAHDDASQEDTVTEQELPGILHRWSVKP